MAIELAAARVRMLPPQALLARLEKRLPLLTSGASDAPQRHRTLRDTVAWSYDLLTEDERALFRRLGVFAGGWTFETAEAVANSDGTLDVFDGVSSLIDKSLVRSSPQTGDEPRFAMLESIREFADEQRTAQGEAEQIAQAFTAYYVKQTEEADYGMQGPDQLAWLARLEEEHDNLRAALPQSRERGDARSAIRLAASLWRFWWLHGHVSEGRLHLEATLAMDHSSVAPQLLAAALDGAGILEETQGHYDVAAALHEQALALSRTMEDSGGIARSLGNLGIIALDHGDFARARSLLEESLLLAREVGNRSLIGTVLNDLGIVAMALDDVTTAESLIQESLALRRQVGSVCEIARSLNNLGSIADARGDFTESRRWFEESLALYRVAGDKWGIAGALIGLSTALRAGDEPGDCTALLQESLALLQETGDIRNAAIAHVLLGEASREQGDLNEAITQYKAALIGAHRFGDRDLMINALAGLGGVLSAQGIYIVAARLLGAVSSFSDGGVSLHTSNAVTFKDDVATVGKAMSQDAFAVAWETGLAHSIDDAVALATQRHTI